MYLFILAFFYLFILVYNFKIVKVIVHSKMKMYKKNT